MGSFRILDMDWVNFKFIMVFINFSFGIVMGVSGVILFFEVISCVDMVLFLYL